MTTIDPGTLVLAKWIRWFARGISALAAGFWLLILVDILACDALAGFICLDWEMALFTTLVAFSVLSAIVAWRKEGIGGLVMILWGFGFAKIAYVTSRPYEVSSMLATGVPFLIAGSLFLASWRLHQPMAGNDLRQNPL